MDNAERNRIMALIEEQDIRFIKLAFCDIFGQLKNISISSKSLPKAMEQGVGLNAASVRGFLNMDDSDLLLFPDPYTLTVIPWRPTDGKVARFFCEIRQSDGKPFEGDVRSMLKAYGKSLKKAGTDLQARTECEFYLFRKDAEANPTDIPMDRASYFEAAPIDKGENIRREICLTMEQMGITYVASQPVKPDAEKIAITIRSKDRTAEYSGKPITAEDRQRIDAALRGDSLGGSHLGLANICTRLRLIYGDGAVICVETGQDGLTHVILEIPQEGEG